MLPILSLILVLGVDPDSSLTPRKPNPFAPSLPLLTEEEEKKIEEIVDRFIDADTGKLKGADAKKAMDDFRGLGPEATFALIRGMNKSASIDHSCPALTIARKLSTILRSSTDKDLLQYSKENIGLGVKQSKHMDVIRDLKVMCSTRQATISRLSLPSLRNVPSVGPFNP